MLRRRPWFYRTLVALAVLGLVVPTAAASGPGHSKGPDVLRRHQESATARGAPSPLILNNFELLGRANLGGGVPNGDVFFYDHGGSVGKYAYVGTWSAQCTGHGAKIIDVNDPTKPRWVGFVGARKGSSNEDVVVVRIGDRDVLGIGVQQCGRGGSNGLALFDVTDPRKPTELSFLPVGAQGVHELDLVVRPDGTALALLAIPFSEFFSLFDPGTDERGLLIADITDPTNPSVVGGWTVNGAGLDIPGASPEIVAPFHGLGHFPFTFAHSARAADEGRTAYVSYWDAGVIKLDISDPANPTFVGRTVFNVRDDGDAHSMTPYDVNGTRYILQNDEDYEFWATSAVVTSTASWTDEFHGIQQPWAAPLHHLDTVTGEVHDAVVGCDAADYADAAGKIALADTVDPEYDDEPPCLLGQQAMLAAAAGAAAFVPNLLPPDTAYPFWGEPVDPAVLGDMPVVMISDIAGLADSIRGAGATVSMPLVGNEELWGFLRVFQEDASESWTEVGRFVGPADTVAPGSWSIHNTEVLGNRAYSSWYSAGIIALDLTVPTSPEMVGQFVPRTSARHANSLGVGPAEVWGVAIDPETGIIYVSEMRTGLWIVRPTGDAAVSD
jgi:hypothetical protein